MNDGATNEKSVVLKNLPNMITLVRMLGAIGLIFLEVLTVPFFVVYLTAGVSDALDGFIARKFNLSSLLGSVLDSIADLTFYTIMMIKMLPVMRANYSLVHWIIIFSTLLIHIVAYIVCAARFKRFSAIHTYLNKAAGVFVFLMPLSFIGFIPALYNIYAYVGGAVAFIASTETLIIHIAVKEYDDRNKSIFLVKK